MTRTFHPVPILVLALSLLGAGCGTDPGDDDASDPDATANPSPTPDGGDSSEAPDTSSPTSAPAVDADQDGSPEDEDCDDHDANSYPGAAELCDGKDNNCSGAIDEGVTQAFYADLDQDGYGDPSDGIVGCQKPADRVENGGDCDDGDADVHPNAAEACDGLDNNCDGLADDGLRSSYYRDADADGFGTTRDTVSDCAVPSGYTAIRGDCDDTAVTHHPGAEDLPADGVDQDCGGGHGPEPHVGLSAGSAASIQAALDQATAGAVIWVGPGTYLEHNINYRGKAVSLVSTHFAADTVLDAGQQGRVLVFTSGEEASSVLDGFTVTGGYVDGADGGGIFLSEASPTLTGLIVRGNMVEGTEPAGGGLYAAMSSASIQDCIFQDNHSSGYGGGVHLDASDAVLEGCALTVNEAGRYGGGIALIGSNPTLTRCTIRDNVSDEHGGGISLFESSPTLDHCTVQENTASQGGGMHAYYLSNPVIDHSLFQGNYASSSGGGIYADFGAVTLTHSILQGNRSSRGAGLNLYHSSATIRRSIVVDNSATSLGGGIYLSDTDAVSTIDHSILAFNSNYNLYNDPDAQPIPLLSHNDLYDPAGVSNHNLDQLEATNRIDDPRFLSSGIDGQLADFHLATDSPLIDAGDPEEYDADGSRSDIGLYSGEGGDALDLDGDGVPDYFWPGSLDDAPEGFDPEAYDCNDRDATAVCS